MKRKYLSAFPEISMYYNKPNLKNFKKSVVANGNALAPKSLNQNVYVFEKTTQIDSVFNVFFHSYCNFIKFNEFCKLHSKDELFFQSIEVNGSKNVTNYHNNRLIMLLKIGEIVEDTIHCKKNVGFYLSELMGKINSLTMIIKCEICDFTQTSNHNNILPSLKISIAILEKNNFVEILLNELFKNHYACGKCNGSLQVQYNLNNYVSIDIEDQNLTIELCKIQQVLNYDSKEFILAGVIEFEVCTSGLKKYTALCRSLQGFWNTKENIKRFKNITEKNSVKVAVIIYIQN